MFTSLYFRTLWPNWPNFCWSLKKSQSMTERRTEKQHRTPSSFLHKINVSIVLSNLRSAKVRSAHYTLCQRHTPLKLLQNKGRTCPWGWVVMEEHLSQENMKKFVGLKNKISFRKRCNRWTKNLNNWVFVAKNSKFHSVSVSSCPGNSVSNAILKRFAFFDCKSPVVGAILYILLYTLTACLSAVCLKQVFPNFLWPCTPSAFRQMDMYP